MSAATSSPTFRCSLWQKALLSGTQPPACTCQQYADPAPPSLLAPHRCPATNADDLRCRVRRCRAWVRPRCAPWACWAMAPAGSGNGSALSWACPAARRWRGPSQKSVTPVCCVSIEGTGRQVFLKTKMTSFPVLKNSSRSNWKPNLLLSTVMSSSNSV
jgi:hypothetical protein